MVIATVFLTIIGITAGFVLGERDRSHSQPGGSETSDTAPVASAPAVDGPLCPDATLETAGQSLYQVLKIVTADHTTVWICQDANQGLYYQGKTGDRPLKQHDNGLFLTGVRAVGDGEYEVYDQKGNRFEVTRKRFSLYRADGKRDQSSPVVESE
ncbi:hypothetical protein ACQP2F_07050 [Actinoplanes sp. CA-030573]|uniref:hypothetical protein n=1 Tax=Actinoplanes sp. CA-030573 TaxID=3239898 RepID=UPI003D917F45